jgi:aminomethyltransferase
MGRLFFSGKDALPFLQKLLTRNVSKMTVGKVRYSLIVNQEGYILDDVLVSRIPDQANHPAFSLVVNASNRDKIIHWIKSLREQLSHDFEFDDQTTSTAMIAVQGPQAVPLVASLVGESVRSLRYYETTPLSSVDQTGGRFGTLGYVSRTGYTGEDGLEVSLAAESGTVFWQSLLEADPSWAPIPAGLAARDTLRLEAGMPLYGHELSETIDPYTAGLGFAVQLAGEPVGHEALAIRKEQQKMARIGLAMEGKRDPRQDHALLADDRVIGEVTSGTFSPTLQRPIAMGYVPSEYSAIGTKLQIDIRGKIHPATVVRMPFYQRAQTTL